MACIISDFRDKSGEWKKTLKRDGVQHYTVSGSRWHDMVKRVTSEKYHKRRPNYIGCVLTDKFKDFQRFTDWHTEQVGYGLPLYALDKDILVAGNKTYSEDCCVLVPMQLNSFTNANARARGELARGVYAATKGQPFVAGLSVNGRYKRIGAFRTEEAAAAAYKAAKEAEAYRWYERLKAGEFIVDERVIERMRTWTLEGE